MYNARYIRFECFDNIMHEYRIHKLRNKNHIINNKICLLLHHDMFLRVLS